MVLKTDESKAASRDSADGHGRGAFLPAHDAASGATRGQAGGLLKRSRDRLPLLLAVLCLAVFLPGVTWGIPQPTHTELTHAWGNDDLVPLAPLAEMHNTFVVSKPDRNIAYPWFHYFLLACAYVPYLAYLLLTGQLSGPSPFYPFGLADPVAAFTHLSWIGRAVSIALAVALVLGAYSTGKHLWGRTAGFFGALFAMLMFPLAYYAKLGNLDVPVLAWTSLGLAVVALVLRQGLTVKRGVWLAVFVALALASKDQSFGSFFLLTVPLLVLHVRRGKPDRLWRWTGKWVAPAATMGAFLVAYVLASGIPIDPARYQQHIAKTFLASTQTIYLRHPATPEGYAAQANDLLGYLADVMSWPLIGLAVLGALLAVRRDRLSLVLLLASAGFFLILLPVRFSRIHYLLPVALPLCVFAGFAIARLLAGGAWLKLAGGGAAVVTTGLLLLQAADLTHDMLRDSRYAAGDWLAAQVRPGDKLLFFRPALRLPYVHADWELVQVEKRAEALPAITQARPEFILVMPDDTNEDRQRVEWRFGPHSVRGPYLPAEVYARLVDGSLGYRPVAQFQAPRLLPWLERPFLSYPTVNPPVLVFVREDRAAGLPSVQPWETAPHYPRFVRVSELTLDRPTAASP